MALVALDTHIVIFSVLGELTARERTVLTTQSCGISAIVLWELAMLSAKRRIAVDLDDPVLVAAIGSLHLWPIDLPVARASTALDFASDPADQIIAATSIVHGAPLLTRDKRIRGSRLVPLA